MIQISNNFWLPPTRFNTSWSAKVNLSLWQSSLSNKSRLVENSSKISDKITSKSLNQDLVNLVIDTIQWLDQISIQYTMYMYMAYLCFCQIYREISVKPPPGKSRNLKKNTNMWFSVLVIVKLGRNKTWLSSWEQRQHWGQVQELQNKEEILSEEKYSS